MSVALSPRPRRKFYLIRLKASTGHTRWAYVGVYGNFKLAAKLARQRFGDQLNAIEPHPVSIATRLRKGYETYNLGGKPEK